MYPLNIQYILYNLYVKFRLFLYNLYVNCLFRLVSHNFVAH
jgi:hypothetical protein